ncbi:probable protein phosphatase 2C 52 [Glycine max]|uniref:probable protein phosphatase 2C 52 n=1 Tax=Glycine max TaxID=3847 RepID=UPI000E21BC0E|nr:probable protein phosphatase 2C 52 [Glycine max]|eukprot:XP_025983767.1 probable protein phosphatase 2C 52 [Glycine max]
MLMPQNGGSRGDVHVEDNQNMSFPWWEGTFMRCFTAIDEKLAKNIDTDGFHGGSTSVSVLKQGDQVIIGNVRDSRAVLCRRAPDNRLIPVQLTVDLTPDIPREAMRIFAVEEDPTVNRVWMPKRDCPGLAMIWDVLTNSEVINIVASAPKRSVAAKLLVNHAARAWKYKYGFKIWQEYGRIKRKNGMLLEGSPEPTLNHRLQSPQYLKEG